MLLTFPFTIHAGHVRVPLHSLLEPLAFFAGFRYFLYLRKRNGDPINQSNRISIFIAAIFGALFGSRLVGGLENPPAMLHAKHILIYFYENKTVLGGFLGGLWAVELVKKFIGERQASGDLFVYPILLALIIGRIGCFSMGVFEETYGTPTSLPWGMYLGDGLRRHPVALYEILFLLLLGATLRKMDPLLSVEQGARFKVFLIAYCAFRLLLDFIKPHYTFPIGLSTIQLASIAGLIYYFPHIIRYARKTLHVL
ncbi:MAG TPA: prolipoprotein diacylglyceryl transferase family protein [Puia sp.]|nr:prolipoprotein diacylglyceryl transferase family protein [Puia sp.]